MRWKFVADEQAIANHRKYLPSDRRLFHQLCIESDRGYTTVAGVHPSVELPYLLEYFYADSASQLIGKVFSSPGSVPMKQVISWLTMQAKYQNLFPHGYQVEWLDQWRQFAKLMGGAFNFYQLALGRYTRAPKEAWYDIWETPAHFEVFLRRLESDMRYFSAGNLQTFRLLEAAFRSPDMPEETFLVAGQLPRKNTTDSSKPRDLGRIELAISFFPRQVPWVRLVTLYPNRKPGWTQHQHHSRWRPPKRLQNN